MPTVNVKTFAGQQHAIEVDLSITVAELKVKIEAATETKAESQRVIMSGRVLSDDSAVLSAAGVTDGATLHLVSIAASAAPTPAAAPATPAAPASLFAGPPSTPQASSPAGTPGSGGAGPPVNPQMMAMLQSPQGQQLVRGIMQNPEILQELARDPQMAQLLRSPDFARALQNPEVMAQIMGGAGGAGGGMGFGPPRPYPAITREIFDDGMRVMNGETLPERYAQAHARHEANVQGGGGFSGMDEDEGEYVEYFERETVFSAMTDAFGPPPVQPASAGPAVVATPASAATPAAVGATTTPAAGESTAPPAADEGGAMDAAADPPAPAANDSMEVQAGDGVPEPAVSPIPAEAPPPTAAAPPAAPVAAAPAGDAGFSANITPESLAQLAAMGFTDNVMNRQALEASQGDIGMALTFLMGGP